MIGGQKLIFGVIEQEKEMLLHGFEVCLRTAPKLSYCKLFKGPWRHRQVRNSDSICSASTFAFEAISRSVKAFLNSVCAGGMEKRL